jgi:hypothetical protein
VEKLNEVNRLGRGSHRRRIILKEILNKLFGCGLGLSGSGLQRWSGCFGEEKRGKHRSV